jgi:uncharacterized membrane protein YiaA
MKETMRRIEFFSFFDHTGISTHLKKMALQGWLLERMTTFGWIYRRSEPKAVQYAISYYPQASEFDPEPSEAQKSFHEFCLHTGWELVASSAQMQVFRNDREDPVPIDTDPEIELQNIQRSAKKTFFPVHVMLLCVSVFNSLVQFQNLLLDPITFFSAAASLHSAFSLLMLLLMCTMEIGGYLRWRRKARKAAERGEFCATKGCFVPQRILLAIVLLSFAWWIITMLLGGDSLGLTVVGLMLVAMFAVLFLVNAIKQTLKRNKATTGTTRTVTIAACFVLTFALVGLVVFGVLKAIDNGAFSGGEPYLYKGNEYIAYHDTLPLTVEDLIEIEDTAYTTERKRSETFLLATMEAMQFPRLGAENYAATPHLEYTIVVVKAPFLYDLCKSWMFGEQDESGNADIPAEFQSTYEPMDASSWNAVEAFQLVYRSGATNRYLLCYHDRLIEITFNWKPTPEQMAIVAEKLS